MVYRTEELLKGVERCLVAATFAVHVVITDGAVERKVDSLARCGIHLHVGLRNAAYEVAYIGAKQFHATLAIVGDCGFHIGNDVAVELLVIAFVGGLHVGKHKERVALVALFGACERKIIYAVGSVKRFVELGYCAALCWHIIARWSCDIDKSRVGECDNAVVAACIGGHEVDSIGHGHSGEWFFPCGHLSGDGAGDDSLCMSGTKGEECCKHEACNIQNSEFSGSFHYFRVLR